MFRDHSVLASLVRSFDSRPDRWPEPHANRSTSDIGYRFRKPWLAAILGCCIGFFSFDSPGQLLRGDEASATAIPQADPKEDADRSDQERTELERKAGFVWLFDGKTRRGWNGSEELFRIQDESIVGGSLRDKIPRNEFLTTEDEFDDFELRLQAKLIGKDANAGIQIRSRRIPEHHEMIGYQVDMGIAWENVWWGKLYDESRRNKILAGPEAKEDLLKLIKEDDWNDYRIVCQGRRIQIWLNGKQTVDYSEPDEAIELRGLIGLQIHAGPPSEAWYRNIRIKKL